MTTRRKSLAITLSILLLSTFLIYKYWESSVYTVPRPRPPFSRRANYGYHNESIFSRTTQPQPQRITLVTVMCHGPQDQNSTGSTSTSASARMGISRQMTQIQVMLKSLLLMEHEYLLEFESDVGETLELIVFTDYDEYYEQIVQFLYDSGEFHAEYLKPLKLVQVPVEFPTDYAHLKYFFRPCSTLRLFIDTMLPSHDAIVYLDTDIIFMNPVRQLYNDFFTFNKTQWCGMGMDWYHQHPKPVPYYGPQGLNSGVGLYNLTRMRASKFSKSLAKLIKKYLYKAKFPDQDVLNVYFNSHPEEMKLLSCTRNFIPSYCRLKDPCFPVSPLGVTILHGISMKFMPGSAESQLVIAFKFFQSLKLTQLQVLEEVEMELRQLLYLNEGEIRSLSKRPPNNYEECAKASWFLDAMFGDWSSVINRESK